VVAVAPDVAAYPYKNSGYASASEQQRIPQPYLPSQGVIEDLHGGVRAVHLPLQ
jgi:hypothetical protein